ncbi:TonB-dependent receptor domain-containing protein [Pseudoalteromonas prydzensis]|uniref:TonB-dependent receptor domain-containing protein n=1 Tax=Pseudoalteromonas prydzensis TaxID=182141 RepID=UPI003FCFE8FD
MFKKTSLSRAIQYSLLLGSASFASAAFAAEEEVKQETTQAAEVSLEEEQPERIEVTGSRIRRAEFSQASPIQVISGDISREMGLFDAGAMLQTTNQAAGAQIDNTFGGYVLDNGPGAATIGFRGLGAERTLVLLNGRRMAPAGVGGAPTSADLNLIPGVMISRVENLFDGASTVYGSDAVAGVANIILRKDVEGFEVQGSYKQPKGDGGEETVMSAMWGTTYDNGFVTVGAEYTDQKSQSRAGNPFLQGCEERIWESEEGDIITRNSGNGPIASNSACDIYPLTNRMSVPSFWGSVYRTPGFSNTGIPNFSETTVDSSLEGYLPTWVAGDFNGDGIIDFDQGDGVFVDGNGDGLRDVDFTDPFYAYQQSDYYRAGDYLSQNKRFSVMLNGEHSFNDDANTTFYYEGLYARRESPSFTPGYQFFPTVAAENAYNPCGVYGIDCFEMLGAGPAGPQSVQPILNIRGDRDRAEVEVSQYRLVTGVTGDLPIFEALNLNGWYYDVYASYSASKGTDSYNGINANFLAQSLDTVVADDGTVSCADSSNGCVPVNLFSDNIYQAGGGSLTEAEAGFLFSQRYMETKVNQLVVNGFIGGELFALPWNSEQVNVILGAEFRRDEIESNPNAVASEGQLVHWYADKGADGSRNLKEIFTEFEFPLARGLEYMEELTITASGRISEESFYDAESTYSLKGVYRPVDWFTLRATKGTSYRAPNLRERFLNGTTGFVTVSDPCVVPSDARVGDPLDPNSITYDPNQDSRDASTLAACSASGVDPTTLGLGQDGSASFTSSTSTEVVTGGSEKLNPETSIAKTYGFVFEQPFSDDFDFTISATRFDIEVTNSIAEPSAGYSVNQCYSADGNDAFCSRIDRGESGQIDLVDGSFINIGLITSKGYDFNVYYDQDFLLYEQNFGLTVDLQATKMTESKYDVLGTVDDNLGEPDYPEWRAYGRIKFAYDDYSFNWETRYIGKGEEDDLGEFEEFTDGCTGLTNSSGAPLQCRPLAYTEDYWVHNISFNMQFDAFSINAGIRNVFNDAPPKVDPNGSFSSHNIPLGVGYDTFGRTPFINFKAQF